MPSVLFVCVANSCRSQMAEAAVRMLAQPGWEAWSAGSHPGGRVHPVAIEAMRELRYDLTTHHSKGLADVPQRTWDVVVTMGCGDSCPTVPATRRLDWAIPDPVGMPPEGVRAVRDDLIRRVTALVRPGPA